MALELLYPITESCNMYIIVYNSIMYVCMYVHITIHGGRRRKKKHYDNSLPPTQLSKT